MLTLAQILRETPESTFRTASTIIPKSLRVEGESIRTYEAAVAGGSGRPHRTVIEFHGKRLVTSPVVVTCTCENYAFNYAYALSVRGSGRDPHADYPIRRNPQLKPGLCRHIAGLARLILDPRFVDP